jgi:hypothetical protein
MRTVSENLKEMAESIKAILEELLIEHSSIRKWNHADSGIINFSGDYSWIPLKEEGLRKQSKVLEDYRRFSVITHTLLKGQPEKSLEELSKANNTLYEIIEQHGSTQHGSTWIVNTSTAFMVARNALDSMVALFNNLYDVSDGASIYVPDTNALLYNPQIENWRFTESSQFTIALIPTVLSELDKLKVNHRVEDVRKKAEGLIRRIKEYRRRGKLTEGVTIVQNKIDLIALAPEPNVDKTFPWLDKDNSDDRILAATVEVMRLHPRSAVTLVTRDINLQNKAEFARMPFTEPPD